MVVPVSIRIPKTLEMKLRESLIGRDGSRYQANSDLTKALESALGCNIKKFNFFLPDHLNSVDTNGDHSNSVKSNGDHSSSDISLDLKPKAEDLDDGKRVLNLVNYYHFSMSLLFFEPI
jgi:hypothetical protein